MPTRRVQNGNGTRPAGLPPENTPNVAIINVRVHFLSVLIGVANNFLLYLLDRLIPSTKITLNLRRHSNTTSTVSAYAHLCGPFDYNKIQLAPMGCAAQIHEKKDKLRTWAYHSVNG